MKNFFFPLLLLIACTSATSKDKKMETIPSPKSIHEFKVPSISGGTIDFSEFKGKKKPVYCRSRV